jgi:NTP pyrophosphatase (non-canonical NTP hydrolase)
MKEAFNELSHAEAERLAFLAEEAGEVVQAVGKILRHGYESFHPEREEDGTNRSQLAREIGDFLAIVEMMVEQRDISAERIAASGASKRGRVLNYAHHQLGGQP